MNISLVSTSFMRLPFRIQAIVIATILCSGWSALYSEEFIQFPTDNSFLPESWLKDPIEARIEPLDRELIDTAREIIQKGIEKYPKELIKEFLNGVHIVGSLRFYDVGYGGTYMSNAKRIALVYRSSFDPRGFEQRFHHEFSSILLKQNVLKFDAERWLAGNETSFVYRARGVIEEQSGDRSEATKVLEAEQKRTGGSGSSLLALDTQLMKVGFLTRYNRVSIEQDLNETAAHLFTNPDLWWFCHEHPRIDHKVDVLIDFYRALHPDFDRIYFRDLTLPTDTSSVTP